MFWQREPEYRLVEIEKPRNPGDINKEMREAVISLAAHPGFNYLMSKFRLQRSMLESVLKNNRHKSLNDVNMLQSGIFWLNWMDSQIQKLTNNIQAKSTVDPTEAETQALQEIQAAIETIGG